MVQKVGLCWKPVDEAALPEERLEREGELGVAGVSGAALPAREEEARVLTILNKKPSKRRD